MKSVKRLFKKIGEADVHVWGYSTLSVLPKEKAWFFSFYQVLVTFKVEKIMTKKMGNLIRKILCEVGRNEMLSWGYGIKRWKKVH